MRHNGAPYITHPAAVAGIVAGWHLDEESVAAALLHDVVEDCPFTVADLEERFGPRVAQIVDGVSKIERIEQFEQDINHHEHTQAESFRKLLLAIAEDWRVILIKLADRLHNMRTLGNIPSLGKRRRIAQETLDIYAPIAERLGFQPVRDELQTLAFEHIRPLRCAVLRSALQRSAERQRVALPKIRRQLTAGLKKAGIKAKLHSRSKGVYSVYRKMIDKDLSFREVDDIIGFRLIVDERLDCYTALGVVHEKFRPVPEKVKDYIAQPKPNGYQSIHTTVLAPNGNIIELQIRTAEMDQLAEAGVAAHWKYKESGAASQGGVSFQRHTNKQLDNLFSMSKLGIEPGEFLRNIRLDLYPEDIFALTPKGKVIQLNRGATVLDLAYAVHTDVGSRADHALVNGARMPISTQLSSGDIVEVKTAAHVAPKPQWLGYVASPKARTQIRHQLKEDGNAKMQELGERLLKQALERWGGPEAVASIDAERFMSYIKHNTGLEREEDMYTQLALDIYNADVVAKDLLGSKVREGALETAEIIVSGDQHAGVVRASCCEPLPPEPIVGLMRRTQGVQVHKRDCPAISKRLKAGDYLALRWDEGEAAIYRAGLKLECTNRKGLMANVLSQFGMMQVNIVMINLTSAERDNPVASIQLVVEVEDVPQLDSLLNQLNRIKGVTAVRASMPD